MARGKKKEELSLEEKLEQALVPAEEQPYEMPGNWCWTRLKSINQFEGESINPMNSADDLFELYSVPSSEADYPEIVSGSEIGSTKQLVLKNDVLLCKINPRINRVWYVKKYTENCLIASSEWIVIRSEMLNPKYLMWCMRAKYFREYMLSNVSGVGGSLMRAQPKYVNMYPIPLAPLEEQRRIVEKIESLFAKLDEVKEKVQNTLDAFENRKAVILHKAFQGALTEKWRKKRNINILDWKQKTIRDVCNDIKVGIVIKPTQYYTEPDNGVAAFRSANVREGYIEDENWVYINWTGQQENKRSEVHTGDVLVVRSGNPGTACVVTEEYDGFNAIDIIIAVPDKSQIDSKYLCYYTNSPEGKGLVRENKRGMALPHFNVGGYSKLPIKIPSLEEQNEIVRIIEMQMSKEQKSKEILQSIIDEIDVMKKSILVKAFRGELGTNNPKEESSMELLKKILMEA